MADKFAEIRSILDRLSTRLEALEDQAVPVDDSDDDLDPSYFDAEVAFLDGAASFVARYGARLRARGDVLSVRFLLGDLAWGIDWLVSAGALDDVNAWDAAAAWFEARAEDAPDPVTMILTPHTADPIAFVSALERLCWLGRQMIVAERNDRDGAGLTGTEAIKVVEKVIRHKLAAYLSSVVPRFAGDTVGTRQTWPVIQTLADYLRAEYVRMGEATHAGSLGQPGTPSNDPPPYSTPK